MFLLDNMPNLEQDIRRGLLLDLLVRSAKEHAITFENGILRVDNLSFGTRGVDFSIEVYETALRILLRKKEPEG